MTRHSVNNNTRIDLVIFLYSNSNHLISLIPPKTASDVRHLLSCGTVAAYKNSAVCYWFIMRPVPLSDHTSIVWKRPHGYRLLQVMFSRRRVDIWSKLSFCHEKCKLLQTDFSFPLWGGCGELFRWLLRGVRSGALNEELLKISYNELEIYQDWESLLVIA